MDDRRAGWLIRRIRQHLGLRQIDVASLSGVSQSVISDLELGRLDATPLRTIRAVLGSLGASGDLFVRWRGGDLDRLADEDHARLVGAVVRWLGRHGWTVLPEVTYSVYGERGAIDVVAWHVETRTLLIIEVNTELTSIEATLRKHDEKMRLGAASSASGSVGSRGPWVASRCCPIRALPGAGWRAMGASWPAPIQPGEELSGG